MAKFLLWCILLVICWPLALLAVIAYPFVWLVLLPFRIVGIAVGGVLELVSAIIFSARPDGAGYLKRRAAAGRDSLCGNPEIDYTNRESVISLHINSLRER